MAETKFGSNRKPGTVIEGNFGSNRTKKAKAKTSPETKKRGRPKKTEAKEGN
tara:strand:+ start:525 stop:680 length:156 start_codon:yes stop_codon:yes gene_type:complete